MLMGRLCSAAALQRAMLRCCLQGSQWIMNLCGGGRLIPGAGPHRFQVAEHLDRGAVGSTWMVGERGGREGEKVEEPPQQHHGASLESFMATLSEGDDQFPLKTSSGTFLFMQIILGSHKQPEQHSG